MSLTRFIMSNIFNILMIGMIILLKRLFHNKVSRSFHYHIWMILLFSIGIIFVPMNLVQTNEFNSMMQVLTTPQIEKTKSEITAPDMPEDWRDDVSEIIDTSGALENNRLLVMIWVVGFVGVLIFYYFGNRMLKSVKRFSELPSEEIQEIFQQCYVRLAIKKQIVLLQSELVGSPMSFGGYRGYIILPNKALQTLSSSQIEHVLLHELMHFKHKDTVINGLCRAMQLFYWFNPFVWWAFSKMHLDQEAYCDWDVLNHYHKEEGRLCYGETLLYFAHQRNKMDVYSVNHFAKSKKQIKYRIEQIVQFSRCTKKTKLVGYFLTMLLVSMVIIQVPILATFEMRFDLFYKPDQKLNMIEHDEKDIFGEKQGCAVIYDMAENVYDVYHAEYITKRIAPCSTYKIYSALNALEQGIITPVSHMIKWDHLSREISEWNQDQDLNSAIKYSVNWYFQELDKKAGISELSKFYTSIGYGNGYLGNDANYYWNGESLKISPLEQVQLLVKFYHNDFEFDAEHVQLVKQALFISDSHGNKLYGKTGTGKCKNHEVSGWFIGYVETNTDKTYFFAVNLQDTEDANGSAAIKVTQAIFEEMGIQIE